MTSSHAGSTSEPEGPEAAARRLAFVFTDVEGSTRLLEQLRDAYAEVLAEHGRLITRAAATAGGSVVDTQGDAFFLVFPTPTEAIAFASSAQRALDHASWPGDAQVRVRMGIHSGVATRTAAGYVGLDVHLAARVAQVAHGGQVLLTEDAARAAGAAALAPVGPQRLKDFDQPVVVHQLLIDGLPGDFPPPRSADDADQPPTPGEAPYPGLAHFEEHDAERFFGRETIVERLLDRLSEHAFLAIVGASGSGKSSIVRAGLLPALRRSGVARVVLLTPTDQPFASLAAALEPDADDDERQRIAIELQSHPQALVGRLGGERQVALIVDQAEELFSLVRDEEARAKFIGSVLAAAEAGVPVVLSLRADFYERVARYPALRDAVADHQHYVGQMSPDELRRAITGPAEAGGWRFDRGLVELILHDVGDEPGALPLLSHALLETWQRRRGTQLQLRGYLESGGVEGAIARSADRLMTTLTPDEQSVARAIFLRLTELGTGAPDTRRRAQLSELLSLSDPGTADRVLRQLADHRLVVLSADSAEVAHEALIREWPTLREWLAADRESLRLHRAVTEAATDWQRAEREPSLLFRGARLAAALDWAPTHDTDLNDLEREFVAESREASEREAAHQRRTNRRLRGLLVGAGVLLLAAIAAGTYAALEARRADDQAAVARSRELAASAQAALDTDPSLAKLLALSAAATAADPPIEVLAALHRAWAADRIIARYAWSNAQPLTEIWVDRQPGGNLFVAGPTDAGKRIEVTSLDTGEVVWAKDILQQELLTRGPVFSLDGAELAVGFGSEVPLEELDRPEEAGVFILRPTDGSVVRRYDLGRCGGIALAASARHILAFRIADDVLPPCAVHPDNFELVLVERDTGALQQLSRGTMFGAMSDDGTRVAFDYWDEGEWLGAAVMDIASLEQRCFVTREQGGSVWALSGDGELMVVGDGPLDVWDVSRCQRLSSYGGHARVVVSVDFSLDGNTVFSTGSDGALHHWSVDDGTSLMVLPSAGAARVSVGSDGSVLVGRNAPAGAVLVQMGTRGEVDAWQSCPGSIMRRTLHATDDAIAFGASCADTGRPETRVLDRATGDLLYPPVEGHAGEEVALLHDGSDLALSSDGRLLARQSARWDGNQWFKGALEILDVASGTVVRQLQGVCEFAGRFRGDGVGHCADFPEQPFPMISHAIAWSPDGQLIAAADHPFERGFAAVWAADTGVLLHTVLPDPSETARIHIYNVTFSPDSTRFLTSEWHDDSGRATLRAYDTRDWSMVAETALENQGLPLRFAGYSADGEVIYAVGRWDLVGDGELHWLDAETLQPLREPVRQISAGALQAEALSPDGSLIATGGAGGLLSVRETENGRLVHEVQFAGTEVQGLAFLNDHHVAVALRQGEIVVVTIDPDELIDIVRASLTRGFTATECARYNFGDACPTLEDMRNP